MKNHTPDPWTLPEKLIETPLDEIARQGARKLIQQALEVEVELHLEKFQYILDENGNRKVVRNGHANGRDIITGAGKVRIRSPRVDDRVLERHGEKRFSSAIVPRYLRRTRNIDELIPVLYLKGISTGDFSEALESILGKEVVGLSAQNVVRLKKVWEEEYTGWMKRDLSGEEYVYWWADGIHFNVRLDSDRQCMLVIVGAKPDGKKEVVAVIDGFRESKESWQSLLRDLKRRGLKNGPKLAIGDGALGFWSAIDEEYPLTKQQICWVHKTANVLDKLPKSLQTRAKKQIHEIYLAPTKQDANIAFDIFIEDYEAKYPKAVESLRKNRDRLMEFYNYPAEQWVHIRSTNVIESTFATVRLRTVRTKGCGSRMATLTMVYKLSKSAEKRWTKLRGKKKIRQVWEGVIFENGIMADTKNRKLVTV